MRFGRHALSLLCADALLPERLQGQHSQFPLDIFWPQNRWHLFAQILPFTPVHLDQILLDILTLAAVPPYPWGHLFYHEVLREALELGHTEGNFAEFGIGLGGTSLFFGQMAKTYGRRLLAVDSFRGLPQPDPLLDEAYFAAGDFRTDGDEPLNGSKAFQELLENFGLEEHVEVLTSSFADVVAPANFQKLAFVHIDGDLYHSVWDALEKVWDLVVPGGIVVIDDFFHKVQGPARATADFFQLRGIVPLLYVVPAYAVLVIKPSETGCTKPPFPRALVEVVERSALRSVGRARENAEDFLEFLRYPNSAAPSGTDILRYLAPLEDMLDLSDGIGPCPAAREGRKVQIPRRKRLEHNFTQCDLLKSADASRSTSCDEHRAFTDAARHHGADELQAANVDGLAG
ncbi:unnamed protein product [Durusdinium trenchii]|uniref:Class I SAM-dependent methyltransferase n=1 Tax=Durusdinium trenchii TaxID=1381693 RepID=A0ABP0RAP0_9DINO